ncbi:MAG: zinc ABC transporter substrate-binding protein, partial [Elusimicrobiaceae bacterium]|nr:zinc ABC transporter substrate-binding protein [Elusimicrobiaceae bacterium]
AQDPHIWMQITNVKTLARALEELLEQLNPGQQLFYRENLKQLEEELDALDQDFKTKLAQCKSREVVHVGHLAFKNLTDAYGLTLTALSGTTHEGEQSAKKLTQLARQIKEQHVPAIFTEEALSSRLASTLAQETGTPIWTLYPVEHISKKDFNANVTYAELMRRNLENLARGLVCQVS